METLPTLLLSGVVFGLGNGVGAVKKEGHDLFEHGLADVDRAVDAIGGLGPVHFAHGHFPGESLSAIAKLNVEKVAAQDNGYTMVGVVMPGRRLSGRQPLPAHEIISVVMQDLSVGGSLHRAQPAEETGKYNPVGRGKDFHKCSTWNIRAILQM
jgi:hypothetical protein